jgi:hypothetical protein
VHSTLNGLQKEVKNERKREIKKINRVYFAYLEFVYLEDPAEALWSLPRSRCSHRTRISGSFLFTSGSDNQYQVLLFRYFYDTKYFHILVLSRTRVPLNFILKKLCILPIEGVYISYDPQNKHELLVFPQRALTCWSL